MVTKDEAWVAKAKNGQGAHEVRKGREVAASRLPRKGLFVVSELKTLRFNKSGKNAPTVHSAYHCTRDVTRLSEHDGNLNTRCRPEIITVM